jgi:hypothetical protein
MPRVRYVGGGGYHIRDGPDFDEAGDEADVGERTANLLCARDDFERVTANAEDADAAAEDGGNDDAAAAEPEPTDKGDESGDAIDDAGGDDDSSFDADEWLEREYQDRADLVATGDVDDHLKTVLEIETSKTVRNAVEARQEA